jgi:calcineurin-like phosphoesterase family protein
MRQTTLKECEQEYACEPLPSKVWVISDLHFDHYNIIKYCDRPFRDEHEMNEVMLSNWNKCVKKNDLVYVLGDVAADSPVNVKYWLRRLRGHKRLVLGNHDEGMMGYNYCVVRFNRSRVLMVHNPFALPVKWDGWVVHGHVHNNAPFIDYEKKRVNVSAEVLNYKPVLLDKIFEAIQSCPTLSQIP